VFHVDPVAGACLDLRWADRQRLADVALSMRLLVDGIFGLKTALDGLAGRRELPGPARSARAIR